MKVKAKGAPPSKKDKSKKAHGGIQKGGNNLKKGKFTIAPKKQVGTRSSRREIYLVLPSASLEMGCLYLTYFSPQHHQAVFKFKQDVKKSINAKNEVCLPL